MQDASPPLGVTARELALHRRALFQLAYRMTGSALDADDIVQETFVRALAHPPADLERPLRPYLVRIAVNLARDALRARRRRAYSGPWLPEPVPTEELVGGLLPGPEARYGERESVGIAFLVALEALSTDQRAVLVLRDVLDYSVAETAEALGFGEPKVKTAHHRARAALARYEATRQPVVDGSEARELMRALSVHLATGNLRALLALLAEDVRATHDAGGEFFAAQRVVIGRERVAKVHLRITRLARARLSFCELNGTLALVADVPSEHPRVPRRTVAFVSPARRGTIARIDVVAATQKLGRVEFHALREPGLGEAWRFVRAALRRPGLVGVWSLVFGPRALRRAHPRSALR